MLESMDRLAERRVISVAMMTNSILPLTLVVLSAVTSLGCIGAEGTNDEEETLGTVQEAALTANALTANALTANALTANALTANALTANALTANALTANALTANALKDPNARELFKYVVSCALPKGSDIDLTINGIDYTYPGELNLAPKWGLCGGSCNKTCQESVSACVLSRIDYLGQKVNISIRGPQAALKPTAKELSKYTYREGAYYGNLFNSNPVLDACVAPGRTGLPRVCGPTTNGCVVDAIGDCAAICEDSAGFGTFTSCADHKKVNGHYPPGTKMYENVITVFLDP